MSEHCKAVYSNGRVSYYERPDGSWFKYSRDSLGNELSFENNLGHWRKYTRDKFGNELSYSANNGMSYSYTRDDNGNVISFYESDDNWYKYTRDVEGNLTSLENKKGKIDFIVGDKENWICYIKGRYQTKTASYDYEGLLYNLNLKLKNKDLDKVKSTLRFINFVKKHQESL